jgi:hypothetical protein
MGKNVDSTDIRQDMIVDDVHYHAKKLGLGGHGDHEGWVKSEEAKMATKPAVSAETRKPMIAVAAYYLAEKRGFSGNGVYEDWIKAEAEIDEMLHDSTGKL